MSPNLAANYLRAMETGGPAPASTSARKQRLNHVAPDLHQHNWDQEPGLDHESSQGRFYVSVIHLWWQICDVSWRALFEIKLETVSSFSGIAVSLDQCSSCCPVPLHMGKKSWHENTSIITDTTTINYHCLCLPPMLLCLGAPQQVTASSRQDEGEP